MSPQKILRLKVSLLFMHWTIPLRMIYMLMINGFNILQITTLFMIV